MHITDLISLLEKRIAYLTSTQSQFLAIGDLAQAERIGAEIASCEESLIKLRDIT